VRQQTWLSSFYVLEREVDFGTNDGSLADCAVPEVVLSTT
jgi:hypothetical protein